MQKLDFNKDGKLVAYTDNGVTDGKIATTEVKGTFEVSADVVKYILAKEYDLPAALCADMARDCNIGYKWHFLHCFIGNDKQQKLLQEYKQILDKVKEELKRLRKAVDDFNKNARFYERKVKI